MTTNELYQQALANISPDGRHGAARLPLSCGGSLFCCVDRVAGCSITKSHMRTTYLLLQAGAEYSKPISREKAAAILQAV